MGRDDAQWRADGAGVLDATRPCLRPDRCPYAAGRARIAGGPALWEQVLLELLPGDPDLAVDIAASASAEGGPG